MKFVLATGGTGGHIFPAIKVAEELQRRGHTAIFVGSFGHQRAGIDLKGFKVYDHGASGLHLGKPLSALGSISHMSGAFFKSINFLRTIKADAILGFGGYGGFPVVLAGVCLRIPTMFHEQNVFPGRANRLLGRWVKRIAVSFKKSSEFFPARKVIHTGLPCHVSPQHVDKQQAYARFGFPVDLPTILVLGGSQGSRRINGVIPQVVKALSTELKFQLIHCCGKQDVDDLKKNYATSSAPVAVFDFLKDIDQAYAIADLIIGRAGAATVMEVAAYGIPAIFIPYPYAGAHQRVNAEALQAFGVAEIIDDAQLTTEGLTRAIKRLLAAKWEKSPVKEIYIPNAEEKIVNSLVELIK